MTKDYETPSIQPSKNFVMPFILLLLSKMSLHGYELSQKLQAFGFHSIDQGNLYRLLRQLEKENLVQSEWDTTGAGPAKRRYTITDVGVSYLKGYANQLESYQTMLDQFFNMYSSFLDLYIPSFMSEGSNREKNANKGRKNNNESEEE
ncbi:poly-beta-hydroxybutyrate-responsive repressor [Bacillus marasmi]|uniref:poly-beta-hydroxybutyrate-responsive repressor n=1 Tax=Bacillus marasmi TaxID=1926279 RepID=UPI0011C7062B|nr:poly-beta-hydroxybutyrate-responsive repressor [Bacillus marasmi]